MTVNQPFFGKQADRDQAILVVSFGTSYPETREKTIDKIEEERDISGPAPLFDEIGLGFSRPSYFHIDCPPIFPADGLANLWARTYDRGNC